MIHSKISLFSVIAMDNQRYLDYIPIENSLQHKTFCFYNKPTKPHLHQGKLCSIGSTKTLCWLVPFPGVPAEPQSCHTASSHPKMPNSSGLLENGEMVPGDKRWCLSWGHPHVWLVFHHGTAHANTGIHQLSSTSCKTRSNRVAKRGNIKC